MIFPKHMLCIKGGQVIVRPIQKFITSESHIDEGRVGPLRAIPCLEKGESMIYDQEGRVVIIGGWAEGNKPIFMDQGKTK